MFKGLFISAVDNCQDIIWIKIIQVLSLSGERWLGDCLDCLYETGLIPGLYNKDQLISLMECNKYVFSARMIGIPDKQSLNTEIITCNDFCSSNSHSIVLCADGNYFEVFSKHEELLCALIQAIPKDCISTAEWIDDPDDPMGGRESFLV